MGAQVWDPDRLARMNYIDAMALIRVEAWSEVGGYTSMRGWEDYDLWCKFVEAGRYGIQVANILGRYRVHHTSMLRTVTNVTGVQSALRKEVRRSHSWLILA